MVSKGLTQVVAGMHVKYIDNIPFVLLGLKPSGVWEFPGGKVVNDEQHYEAMEREWIEELGVITQCDEEHFGHAISGKFEVWFYEVDIVDYEPDTEPIAKEHVEVRYWRLDETDGLEMNQINQAMLAKLRYKYS